MEPVEASPKKYGAAVAMCAVFGTLGIHHFYLGNWVHGILDVSALFGGIALIFFSQDPFLIAFGIFLIVADVIHSMVVTVLLLIGKTRDGQGRIVAYPGQFK